MKERIEKNGHPKGMKGKKHSDEFKKRMSVFVKQQWRDPGSIFNSDEHRQRQSDRMSKLQASGKLANNYSRAKNGTVIIGGKTHFYRSSWEVNIAAYFEFLKNKKEIKEWEYEPFVFWFLEIKRGVRSYKPDFRITNNDGTQYWVEVKGWMDAKSKTKLNRMRIYYPDVKLELIDQKRYYAIAKYSKIIPHWGDLDKGNVVKYKECKVDNCTNKVHSKELCRKHYYKAYRK